MGVKSRGERGIGATVGGSYNQSGRTKPCPILAGRVLSSSGTFLFKPTKSLSVELPNARRSCTLACVPRLSFTRQKPIQPAP